MPAGGVVIWPDESQTLLLHAALAEPRQAHHCFARWCRRRARSDACVDYASGRLLPQVYRNLSREGGGDFAHSRHLRALYRAAWRDGEAVRRGAGHAAALLDAAAIPVLVSKGGVLAAEYYLSAGERPLNDCDFFVPRRDFERARETLAANGWMPDRLGDDAPTDERRAALALGLCLRHPIHGEVDLHGRVIKDARPSGIEAVIWRDALPFRMGATVVRRPAAPHLLLHVLAHGIRPEIVATLRWITDSAAILRKEGDRFDWDAFWRMAGRARIANRMRAGLSYLDAEFAIPVVVPRAWPSLHPVEQLERRVFAPTLNAAGPYPRLYRYATRLREFEQYGWRDRMLSLFRYLGRVARRTLPGPMHRATGR